MMKKITLLKIFLVLGALYYLVGGFTHFFGLTIFPFYDGALYQPYHDTVISLVTIFLALLFLSIARDPIKNIDSLYVVIIGGAIAIVFSVGILITIDFTKLGTPGKKLQTIAETLLLIFYLVALFCLRPKDNNCT